MMNKGFENFSDISKYYIYSFSYEKFIKKEQATKKFGWEKPLEIAM